jgi:acetolactate synthase-1/2/3 large subunit
VSALYTAAMAESPVVLLSGHAPNSELGMGAFQEMRQADVAAPIAKASWTCANASSVAADVARALRIAVSGRPGPVHLSLPVDVLDDTADGEEPAARDAQRIPMPLGEPEARAMLDRLASALRPLILAGPALMTRAGRVRCATLEEATGIPVVGMESPRGVADPSLGAFAEVLAQADAILLLGKRLDFTLRFGRAPALAPGCEFMQVDADEVEFARTRRAAGTRLVAMAIADPYAAIEAFTSAARGRPSAKGAWRSDVRAAIAYRPAAWNSAVAQAQGRLHPVQACRPLQVLLDSHPESVLVVDGGEFGQWAQACLAAPHRVINGAAGAIGAGIPFALGARAARPDAPVIALMGDGTFGFHPAEIDTAMRCGLPFLLMVGNDARWNAEYQIQLRAYGRDRAVGCELLPTRYDQVCAAFGGHGETVTEASELLPAARRALASGKPACLNVMIDGQPAPNIKT